MTKEKTGKAKNRKENKKMQYEIPKLVEIENVGVATGHTCPFGGLAECLANGSFAAPQ